MITDANPKLAIERLLPQVQPQLCDGLVDRPVVKLDALHGIALAAFPVAAVESRGCSAGDRPEFCVVIRERFGNLPGAIFSALSVQHARSRKRYAHRIGANEPAHRASTMTRTCGQRATAECGHYEGGDPRCRCVEPYGEFGAE